LNTLYCIGQDIIARTSEGDEALKKIGDASSSWTLEREKNPAEEEMERISLKDRRLLVPSCHISPI
jgi:hypothetical protein